MSEAQPGIRTVRPNASNNLLVEFLGEKNKVGEGGKDKQFINIYKYLHKKKKRNLRDIKKAPRDATESSR